MQWRRVAYSVPMRAQAVWVFLFGATFAIARASSEIVPFPSGNLTLKGVLFKPEGAGPFPAVVYNHGSAAGMLSQEAFDALGPVFVRHRWVFFGPYRRGQGLSAQAGPYIGDEIDKAKRQGGVPAGAATMVRLLATDHLDDQLAALAWLRQQTFVDPKRVAVAGNSFGGVETLFGVERADYCAAVDSAGGAESWDLAPPLQAAMKRAVQSAKAPIFFFQAQNDWNLAPTRTLSAAMKDAGKPYASKIFPPYGKSHQDGHTFGYFGSAVWENDVFEFLDQHCATTRGPDQAPAPLMNVSLVTPPPTRPSSGISVPGRAGEFVP
jgi:carboxymethylenebutenolidase